ncbi:class I SAM-dependent methyltransferase (plasmid) [Haloferacaceae archaeon DSL9]
MVDKDGVRRSYDELAAVHAAQRNEDDYGTAILAEFLERLSDSALVLDAGCGQGAPVLSRFGAAARAVGLDFSREQLRLAADNAPKSDLTQGELTALPFTAAAFDAIVAYWSLIHVPMDDHQAVLDEFARALRPGGRVLLCEGTTRWIGENQDWLGSGVKMEWNIAGAKATRTHLRWAGFTIVDEWGSPSSLRADADEEDDDAVPWTFFAARLDE